MDLDDILDLDDYSAPTIAHLIDRIGRSAGQTQLVYRESELDELWRLLDIEVAQADAGAVAALSDLRRAIVEAHDLIGIDGAPAAAAERLRAGLDAWQRSRVPADRTRPAKAAQSALKAPFAERRKD